MKKLFLFSILIATCLCAMEDNHNFGQDHFGLPDENTNSNIHRLTVKQLMDENADKAEFMSSLEWIKKYKPDTNLSMMNTHPLFQVLQKAMQLADFEVDEIESFFYKYYETDMPVEAGFIVMKLRETSANAKNLIRNLIDIISGDSKIEEIIEQYFECRLIALLDTYEEYFADKFGKNSSPSNAKRAVIIGAAGINDPLYGGVARAFMRSYNMRNMIMRDLLDYLREVRKRPLTQCLSSKTIGLIRISTSIHPFFNKDNEQWIDYNQAIEKAEVRKFLGYAKILDINLNKYLKRGLKIPKSYQGHTDIVIPRFLSDEVKSQIQKPSKSKKKEYVKLKTKNIVCDKNEIITQKENVLEQTLSSSSTFADQDNIKSNLSTLAPESQNQEEVKLSVSGLTEEEVTPLKAEDINGPGVSSFDGADAVIIKPQTRKEKKEVEVKEKFSNKHIATVNDIFSPQGYKSLNSERIIAAWEHLLQGRGYHKKSSGSSHQPLYSMLGDGSRVVLGLFKSSAYGPRYVKFIREAFEKIGFGRVWLEEQGY